MPDTMQQGSCIWQSTQALANSVSISPSPSESGAGGMGLLVSGGLPPAV
ncbi:hypothetical protein SCH4B_3587 [Ruegeria sp. TrichCH4B]|nr:hypothetical protein SCH4B_3587 [Ruegeria sp. TrichCH4B]